MQNNSFTLSWDGNYTRHHIFTGTSETGLDKAGNEPMGFGTTRKSSSKCGGKISNHTLMQVARSGGAGIEMLERGEDGSKHKPTKSGPEGLLWGWGGARTREN